MSFKASVVTTFVVFSCVAFSSQVLAQSKPAVSAAAPASAASEQAPANKGEEQALRWFRMLDTNNDGVLSKDEVAWITRIRPALAEEFKAADANHDGYVTQDEIRALADQRRAEREARRLKEQRNQDSASGAVSTQ
ncbi:EF-hand domain-containing protein [Ottowia sp. VDI28]|uniref:EF-hand domain-containing protein n=1 Tax=Ottowia sp. VDI28 TaxID=3133968 RepID=UPI003C2F8340